MYEEINSNNSNPDGDEDWVAALRSCIRNSPTGTNKFLERLDYIRRQLQGVVSAELEENLKSQYSEAVQVSFLERQETVERINNTLAAFGLAFRHPVNGLPATLILHRDGINHKGEFYLESCDQRGLRSRTKGSRTLSSFGLMEITDGQSRLNFQDVLSGRRHRPTTER